MGRKQFSKEMGIYVTCSRHQAPQCVKRSERFNLAQFMLMVQQHANRLKDHLKDLRLPEEFLGQLEVIP